MKKILIVISIYLNTPMARAESETVETAIDFPDPKTVRAYEEYWSRLQDEVRAQSTSIIRANKIENQRIEKDAKVANSAINAAQSAKMSEAIGRYRDHLKNSPQASNRPYVLLNLAQMLHLAAKTAEDSSQKMRLNSEAVDYLKEIELSHRDFYNRPDALYLQTIIARELNDEALLQSSLTQLADAPGATLFSAIAAIDLGDLAYNQQNIPEALDKYLKAERLFKKISDSDKKDLEQTRLYYRLAWTKYKSTNLDEALAYAKKILKPGATVKTSIARDKFKTDAADLIADSLYELNQMTKISAFFKDRSFNPYADAVGLRMMKRYYETEIYTQVDKIAQLTLNVSPISIDYPSLLMLGSLAAKKLNLTQQRVDYLEQLVLLAPKKSLWRSKYKNEHNALLDLEKIALEAGQFVAHFYYDRALETGDQKDYLSARTFYDILIELTPNVAEANTWRLRRAHSLYFMDELKLAQSSYQDLIENYKIETSQLEVALYQSVLAREKIWRKAFARSLENGLNPISEKEVLENLADLEKSVDQFSARFPNQSRSVDLLLVAASSNRDQEQFEHALGYLRRSLLSFPNPTQRSLALRGIIFNFIKSKTSGELVTELVQLLSLEDFKKLDSSLEKELFSVLSTAVFEEAKKLNDAGQVFKAAQLMVTVAGGFKKVPRWNEMYRDGAYSLAIAGEWLEAENTARKYLQEPNITLAGDFVYLLARAEEFQLRVGESAKTYLSLSTRFPTHPRADSALERAENLAYTDGLLTLAATAAESIAERNNDHASKIKAYDRCIQYYMEELSYKEALPCARKRAAASKNLKENFKSQITLARISYLQGSEQKAIDDLEILEKRLKEKKQTLGLSFRELSGDVNLQLGLDAKKRFVDFKIRERSGAVLAKVQEKSKLFEELTTRLQLAIDTNWPDFSPQARYELASAAEIFASEVQALPVQEEASMTLKSHARYQKNITQLHELSKRLNTSNLSERRQNPDVYKNNIWMEKSAQALGSASYTKEDEQQLAVDKVKPATQIQYPISWSIQ